MRLITRQPLTGGPGTAVPGPGYRWIALSNTTLGTLMATINGSITLIALPGIFRGIGVNPLPRSGLAASRRAPGHHPASRNPGLPASSNRRGGAIGRPGCRTTSG
jgi:hypothetical protein